MIELIQAVDDLRRSLVIVLQERQVNQFDNMNGEDSYYWNH